MGILLSFYYLLVSSFSKKKFIQELTRINFLEIKRVAINKNIQTVSNYQKNCIRLIINLIRTECQNLKFGISSTEFGIVRVSSFQFGLFFLPNFKTNFGFGPNLNPNFHSFSFFPVSFPEHKSEFSEIRLEIRRKSKKVKIRILVRFGSKLEKNLSSI